MVNSKGPWSEAAFFGIWSWSTFFALDLSDGVVGCGKDVVYITSLRRPADIMAYSWARLAILVAGKRRRGCFYFICFFAFIPVPLSFLSFSFISSSISFLPFSGRRHKMTHKGWGVVKPQHNQSMFLFENIYCWYSLEVLWWGIYNEYPQHVFVCREIRKRLSW